VGLLVFKTSVPVTSRQVGSIPMHFRHNKINNLRIPIEQLVIQSSGPVGDLVGDLIFQVIYGFPHASPN
jgi:hypothetical protein